MLDLEKVADVVEVVGPSRIGAVSAKERLGVGAAAARHRFDVGDSSAATRDRVPLAAVFDGVEEVGEPACRFSGGDFGHGIRLSDYTSGRKGSIRSAPTTNWTADGQIVANSGVVLLGSAFDDSGFISAFVGDADGAAAHVIIDITG